MTTISLQLRNLAFWCFKCNHDNISQTFAYAYQSKNDEGKHLGAITASVLNQHLELAEKPASEEPRALSERKYNRLMDMPQTRILPGYGICSNIACAPRFELCFLCSKFEPDPVYIDYMESAIEYLDSKICTLEKKKGNPKVIEDNKRQKELFQTFIDRIKGYSEKKAANVS